MNPDSGILISAVIPTYNRRVYVQRAIKSILAQTVPVDEIIVVDDGSTDGTAEEIERQFGNLVRVVRQENHGVSRARRQGILAARGQWIAFLDSDDEWTPDRNRILCQALERVPANIAWVFGNTLDVSDAGEGRTQYEKHGLRVTNSVEVITDPLSAVFPWQFGILESSLIKRDGLVELGCFSEDLKCGEDLLAGIQIACRFGFAAVPENVTKVYRTSDLSTSSLSLTWWKPSAKASDLRMDYYRAELKAFSLAATTVCRRPWGELYAGSVRRICKECSRRGEPFRHRLMDQFRYGVSPKSIAFLVAAMLGEVGLSAWRGLSSARRVSLSRDSHPPGIPSRDFQP